MSILRFLYQRLPVPYLPVPGTADKHGYLCRHGRCFIYGYGNGHTEQEAVTHAMENLSTQISTHIQSKLESHSSITGAEDGANFVFGNLLENMTGLEYSSKTIHIWE